MKDKLVFPTTSEEALEVYEDLRGTLPATGLQLRSRIPPQALDLGSAPLQQVPTLTAHERFLVSSQSYPKQEKIKLEAIMRRVPYEGCDSGSHTVSAKRLDR